MRARQDGEAPVGVGWAGEGSGAGRLAGRGILNPRRASQSFPLSCEVSTETLLRGTLHAEHREASQRPPLDSAVLPRLAV